MRKKIDNGICGAWVIGQFIDKPTVDIVNNWTGGYKGYASMKDMIKELKKYGVSVVRKKAKNKKRFEVVAKIAIAFIQWEGNYKHWMEAYKNTHWVMVRLRDDDCLEIGCSNEGWFPVNSEFGRNYLKGGYIRSYLAITQTKGAKNA